MRSKNQRKTRSRIDDNKSNNYYLKVVELRESSHFDRHSVSLAAAAHWQWSRRRVQRLLASHWRTSNRLQFDAWMVFDLTCLSAHHWRQHCWRWYIVKPSAVNRWWKRFYLLRIFIERQPNNFYWNGPTNNAKSLITWITACRLDRADWPSMSQWPGLLTH